MTDMTNTKTIRQKEYVKNMTDEQKQKLKDY